VNRWEERLVDIHLNDLIGYGIAFISVLIAIIIYYKSKLDVNKTTFEIEKLTDLNKLQHAKTQELHRYELDKSIDTHVHTLTSINDIAFATLLRIKNVAPDRTSLQSQYEILVSGLQSIQKIAQRGAPVIFQGEFVYGLELGAIENTESCRGVWLISQDLRPDIEQQDLIKTVAVNLVNGRKYYYVIPSDAPDELPDRLFEYVLASAETESMKAAVLANMSIYKISRHDHYELFSGGAIALYEMLQSTDPRVGIIHILGFDEIVLPNERRGSTWQRQSEARARALFQIIKAAIDGCGALQPPEQATHDTPRLTSVS
jgi:hypothetical protein